MVVVVVPVVVLVVVLLLSLELLFPPVDFVVPARRDRSAPDYLDFLCLLR
jgi:hypothetical protein